MTTPSTALLTAPSASYRRHAWLAASALAGFLVLYLGLSGWFVYTFYRVFFGSESPAFSGYLFGSFALFLAFFMLKACFYVRRGTNAGLIELKPEEQPRLFAFLRELADAAAAPRPHRVFVSAQVNAAVFYDVSVLNLVFPSRKNLEIGFGLVNALSLGELRAVLAHEFGHFTQRSMAIGRWTYVAHQIASSLIARRDQLDTFLIRLSHVDIRFAWIGWILRVIVWSIRSLIDTLFRGVMLLQRALSREMEFHADLVAVSLTGSDALIHALRRLPAADDAWDRTVAFINDQHTTKKLPRNIFAVHARVTDNVRTLLNDPDYARVPAVPADHPERHRIFQPDLARPPRMWLTHPLNHEREENAKRHYLARDIDDRPAWSLFDDVPGLCERVSAAIMKVGDATLVDAVESVAVLDQAFAREDLKPRYRGLYLGRSVVRWATRPDELWRDAPPDDWRAHLDDLYPEALTFDLARLRTLYSEVGQLRALESGAAERPADGVIRHRGRALAVSDLPGVIKEVDAECLTVEERLRQVERRCRSVHLAAARDQGGAWDLYLEGLLRVLHFADHTEANLTDLHGLFGYTLRIVTLGGRVSRAGRERMVRVSGELHDGLSQLYHESPAVHLDATLLSRLGVPSWSGALGQFNLTAPDDSNLAEWIKVIDSWVHAALGALGRLKSETLKQLLETEARIAGHLRDGTPAGVAPEPSRIPGFYPLLLPGTERPRLPSLDWWDRFQAAQGVLPAIARFAVAAGVVGAVLGFASSVNNSTVTIYNGLSRPVTVSVGRAHVTVGAQSNASLSVEGHATYRVEARTVEGRLIEGFDAEVPVSFGNFFYNVGGAAPLVEWTAVYGPVSNPARPQPLGNVRFEKTYAEVLFEEPPKSISTSGQGDTRRVLTGLGDADPGVQLTRALSDQQREEMIRIRARWEPTGSRQVMGWLTRATALADFHTILALRLVEDSADVVLQRMEQDVATPEEKSAICVRHRARARAHPDVPDIAYLALRCLEPEAERNRGFLEGYRRWPKNGWFAQAAGYTLAESGHWQDAIAPMQHALEILRPMGPSLAVDLARVHRMAGGPQSGAMVARLARAWPEVGWLASYETGAGLDSGADLAYPLLARGDLQGAVRRAAADPDVEARVVRLAAASDGAPSSLVERAIAMDSAGLDSHTAAAMTGLLLRSGKDLEPLLREVERRSAGSSEMLRDFAKLLKAGQLDAANRMAEKIPSLMYRGRLYSIGVVALGLRAPAEWRRQAKGLLFAGERPYFK